MLIDRGLNKKQESSEAPVRLDGGVVLQPKCQKVAVRVRPTRLTVALSPTSAKDQSDIYRLLYPSDGLPVG